MGSLGLMSGEGILYSSSVNKALFEERYSVEMTKEEILRVENDYAHASIRPKRQDMIGFKSKPVISG